MYACLVSVLGKISTPKIHSYLILINKLIGMLQIHMV